MTWREVALGDIAEVAAGGGAPQDANDFANEGHPFVRAGSLRDLISSDSASKIEYLTPEVAARHGLRLFPSNTLLFAKSGMSATIGLVHRLRWPAYVVNHLAALVCRPTLDSAFLLHYLRAFSPAHLIQDAAYPSIRLSDISAWKIPLPPPSEQRRIAAILDKADALRTKRREALALLERLPQSILVDMFGDPAVNSRGWPCVTFESLCSRVTVGIVVRPASYYKESGIPALRSLNIKPGKIVLNDLVYFSEKDNSGKLRKTQLRAGDLVLVRSGRPGTAAVVPGELDGINAIDLLIASPKHDKASSGYLCELFNSSAGRALVLSSQRGQIQKHLNVGSLSAAQIALPPIELQHQFDDRIAKVTALLAKTYEDLGLQNALFESLQHRAFSGRL
ncbi:MAG: restriction endonuclease subunit S [Burkholderiaceae bacterium]|nr:restriction endonuclease subunit S [Burkholderiaceae bacterium]